jgi:hypothetical protein
VPIAIGESIISMYQSGYKDNNYTGGDSMNMQGEEIEPAILLMPSNGGLILPMPSSGGSGNMGGG